MNIKKRANKHNNRTAKKNRQEDEPMSAGEMSEEEIPEDKELDFIQSVFDKHQEHIGSKRRQFLAQQYYDKMLFYLELEMNLLIYGVGSKREFF